jgi:hypothetical protein
MGVVTYHALRSLAVDAEDGATGVVSTTPSARGIPRRGRRGRSSTDTIAEMAPLRRVAFFGSPEFALPTLEALAESRFRPILVVSQPPRPAGRGRRTEDTAVAVRARELGL